MNSRYNLSTPEAVEVCWHRWLACSSSRRDNRRRPSPSMFPSNCVSSRLFFWVFFFCRLHFFYSPTSCWLLHQMSVKCQACCCTLGQSVAFTHAVRLSVRNSCRLRWSWHLHGGSGCSAPPWSFTPEWTRRVRNCTLWQLLEPFFWCLTIFKQNV